MSDSIPRWILSQSEFEDASRFQWSSATASGVVDHVVEFHDLETFDAKEVIRTNAMRAMCHALVDRLPNDAIEELVEAIVDIFRFYLQKGPGRIEDASERHRVSAKIATTRKKEAFTISED